MKINLSEYLSGKLAGSKEAEHIEYFFIHLIAHYNKNVTEVTKPNKKGEHILDVNLTINGKEMDALEFIEWIFSQYDRQLKESVNEEIERIRVEFQDKFNNLLTQFMHKNGLIDSDKYFEKISY